MDAKWIERIKCVKCGLEQDATVTFETWMPFPARAHECGGCGYVMTESEWELVAN